MRGQQKLSTKKETYFLDKKIDLHIEGSRTSEDHKELLGGKMVVTTTEEAVC